MLWVLLSILGVAGIVLVLQGETEVISGVSSTMLAQAAIGIAMAMFVARGVLSGYGGRLAQAAKDAMTWIALGLVLVLGYSYKDQFRQIAGRVVGELNPGGTPVSVSSGTSGERAVRLRKRRDGHFAARVEINGAPSSSPTPRPPGSTSTGCSSRPPSAPPTARPTSPMCD
jgi:aspartyl protease family protein